MDMSIRKGTWSFEEDSILINYIAIHGEGRWNHLARNAEAAGLKRTGRSCRMRWKNYLRPNVRRGNLTPQEQLRIMELHCFLGNRWSRIAEYLPGRTDNEIKNFWRTRVHKQAKLLKYDVNSIQFRDFIRNIWIPLLSQQVHHQEDDDYNMMMDVIINSEYGLQETTTLQMDYCSTVEAAHYAMNNFPEMDFGPEFNFPVN